MMTNNLLSVAMFAIIFGAAVCKNYRQNAKGTYYVMSILRQINAVCEMLVHWLMVFAPLGVMSLIAAGFATNADSSASSIYDQGAFLVIGFICAVLCHWLISLPAFLYFFTKRNPYTYMRHIIPAQTFAFGCASSAATLPITIRCVEATKEVSRSLCRCVLSLGVPLNKDGSAINFVITFIFMANTSNVELTAANYVLLLIVSIFSSVSVLPIPDGSLIVILSVWTTVLGDSNAPSSFEVVVAANWFVDRIATVMNITGETVVARVMADQVDETAIEELDLNHEYLR